VRSRSQSVLGFLSLVLQLLAASIQVGICEVVFQLLKVMLQLIFQPLSQILDMVLCIANGILHAVLMLFIDVLWDVRSPLRLHSTAAMKLPRLRCCFGFRLHGLDMLVGSVSRSLYLFPDVVPLLLRIPLHVG